MGGRVIEPQRAPLRFGDVAYTQGIVFICACGRGHGVERDKALRAWGEQGRIQEVAARLRCHNCGKKRLRGFVSPAAAGMGSDAPIDALVLQIYRLRPKRSVE